MTNDLTLPGNVLSQLMNSFEMIIQLRHRKPMFKYILFYSFLMVLESIKIR